MDDPRRYNSFKHGLSKHPLFRVWLSMKSRCCKENNKDYKHYGGRGIKVCADWLASPAKFINWGISNGWEKGLSIDRIDNNGNYHPDNCRFVTPEESSRNTRSNVMIKHPIFFGTVAEVAEMMGVNRAMLYARLSKGWPIERVLFEPVNLSKSRYHRKENNNNF